MTTDKIIAKIKEIEEARKKATQGEWAHKSIQTAANVGTDEGQFLCTDLPDRQGKGGGALICVTSDWDKSILPRIGFGEGDFIREDRANFHFLALAANSSDWLTISLKQAIEALEGISRMKCQADCIIVERRGHEMIVTDVDTHPARLARQALQKIAEGV